MGEIHLIYSTYFLCSHNFSICPAQVPASLQTQPECSSEEKQTEDSRCSTVTPEEVRDYFLEYHKKKEEDRYVYTVVCYCVCIKLAEMIYYA